MKYRKLMNKTILQKINKDIVGQNLPKISRHK